MFKKFLLSCTLFLAVLTNVPNTEAIASILPNSDSNYSELPCDTSDATTWDAFLSEVNAGSDAFKTKHLDGGVNSDYVRNFLACAVKTGNIKFWMIPYFIIYALTFVLELAGLIAVLMVVVGGYYYVVGGITDDKEKGKQIITYALGGFALILASWAIVNMVLLLLTT